MTWIPRRKLIRSPCGEFFFFGQTPSPVAGTNRPIVRQALRAVVRASLNRWIRVRTARRSRQPLVRRIDIPVSAWRWHLTCSWRWTAVAVPKAAREVRGLQLHVRP